jgi:integrase
MALTAKRIEELRPAEKPYKVSDGEGMYILVTPEGGRLWQLTYRAAELNEKGNRKQKVVSFGAYPGVSIKVAREKRAEIKKQLAQGIDPMSKAKAEAVAAKTGADRLFSICAEEWLDVQKRSGEAEKTISGKAHRIKLLNFAFGDKPLNKIKRDEVKAFLRGFEARKEIELMGRLRSIGESIFSTATDEEGTANPFRSFPAKTFVKKTVTHRPALVEAEDVAPLFKAMADNHEDDGHMTEVVTLALRFLALTACRPGEVAGARWSEIDLDKALWIIPAERTKMRKKHIVPLSRQALAILRRMLTISGDRQHVFSIKANTFNKRLNVLGIKTKTEHTAHGFRSSFSSIMNSDRDENHKKRWDGEDIELCLAHLDSSSVRAIYNREGPLANIQGRAKLMQAWADKIDTFIKSGEPVPLRRTA